MDIRSPDLFIRGPSPLARLVFYCALAIACIVVDFRFHRLNAFRNMVSALIFPLQEAASLPALLFATVKHAIETPQALQAQNEALKQQLLRQADQAQRYLLAQEDLSALRSLMGLRQQENATHTVTEIVGMAHTPFAQKIVISAGQSSGIRVGSPVISASGLIGQITAVNLLNSEVTLITDKNQAIPVMAVRNGLRTIAFGNGEPGTLSLPYVPIASDIQAGDMLVTSGIDGLYPPGLAVGTVKSVERDSVSAFARILCVPTSAVLTQRYVLVLNVPDHPLDGDLPNLEQPEATPSGPVRKIKKP